MRYADSSIPTGRPRRSPSTLSSTGSPASRTCSTSSGRSARPGCGASGSAASLRSIPTRRRISVSAPRPIFSIVSSTSRVAPLSGSSTRRSAPAWTTIIETLCAIASCSSRAMRARSSTTASRAATSRSRSASWTRRSRSPRTRRTRTITTSVTTANGSRSWKACQPGPAAAARLLSATRDAAPTSELARGRRPHRQSVERAEPGDRGAEDLNVARDRELGEAGRLSDDARAEGIAAAEGESGCQDRCDERRQEPVPAGVVCRPHLRLANGEQDGCEGAVERHRRHGRDASRPGARCHQPIG